MIISNTKNHKTKPIKVAAIQLQTKIGEKENNLRHALTFVEKAVDERAELVILPELASSGYSLSVCIIDIISI